MSSMYDTQIDETEDTSTEEDYGVQSLDTENIGFADLETGSNNQDLFSMSMEQFFATIMDINRAIKVHPLSGKHMRMVQKSERSAMRRLKGAAYNLMYSYMTDQTVAPQDFTKWISEDPERGAKFVQDAYNMIPKHYRPQSLNLERRTWTPSQYRHHKANGGI